MALQIKLGMRVRSVDRGLDMIYKVLKRDARMIVDERTLNVLKIAPRQSTLPMVLRQIPWICYVSIVDNSMYLCPESEFCDGRFVEVPPPGAAKP